MKKFGEIEAKYLKIGHLELLVGNSLVNTVILGANSSLKTRETESKREKKKGYLIPKQMNSCSSN
jgi:hypothetical protein